MTGRLLLAALAALMLVAVAVARPERVRPAGPWHRDLVTTYSWAEGGSHVQGCPSAPPLQNGHHTFASYMVPCGARVQFCYRHRCVVGRRTDSGPNPPHVNGWEFDLNRGLALALRLPDVVSADGSYPGGIASVAWRRIR